MKDSQRRAMWAKRNNRRKGLWQLWENDKKIASRTYVVWGNDPISKLYGGIYVVGKDKAQKTAIRLSKKRGYKFNVRKYE